MIATYDVHLVVFSFVIAVIASYTALNLAGRVTAAQGRARKLWLAGGAIAMGIGIWSMHFIAMLAYKLPIPMDYDSSIVFASLAVAVIASGLALYIVSCQQVDRLQFWAGGSFMGGAIAGMHYIGMAAMQVEAGVEYNLVFVALSVVIAIGASFSALWLTFQLRLDRTLIVTWRKIGSALVMGTAIAGMHYTAMAAVCFVSTNQAVVGQAHTIDRSVLAVAIGIATLVILALTLQSAFVERRLGIEVSLVESQHRLATLIDSLPGIVFSCGNESGWSRTYLSEGCLDLTGYQSEELLGTEAITYNAIIHPEDLPKVLQAIDAALNKQQPYVAEYRICTKSGQQKWLWEKGNGVFDELGEVLGLEGFITDISERKRTEAALHESKKRLQDQNTVLMDLARRKTLSLSDLNAAVREITEAATNTLAIERTSVWLYKDDRSKIQCIDLYEWSQSHHSQGMELEAVDYPAYFQALQEERTLAAHDAHTDPRTTEFSQFYLSPLSITSMLDAPIWQDGEMVGVVCHEHVGTAREWALEEQNFAGSIADLVSLAMEACDRNQAQVALRQAEAKYRSIFENTVEGIFQTTVDGYYISANPALARIYGYESPEELITSLCNIEQQLYLESSRRAEFVRLMQQHDAVSGFEAQVYRQDGSVIWISENARAVRDASGTLLCYEGTVEDITEHKKTHEVQARFMAILEATTDFVGIADVHGHLLYFNQAGRKMLGLDNDQNISEHKITDFHPDWANQLVLNEGIPAALSGKVWTGETALLDCNGQEIAVSQVILAHKTPEGKVEFLATVIRDISDRKRLEAQLAYLANHDPLTGLFNRRHFQEQLENHLAFAQRYNQCGALLFVDLDNFKNINDTLGHQAGDELLKSFATLLQENLRNTDILGRLGGDEFAILLPQVSANTVQLVVQWLLVALELHVIVINGQQVRISASIGATLFPDHGIMADELLAYADAAMYKSKVSGRNCLSLYTPDKDCQVQLKSRNIWKNRICELPLYNDIGMSDVVNHGRT